MSENSNYSSLYSSEKKDDTTEKGMSEEELALIRKGRTKTKVVGIIYLVICGINTLQTVFDFSEGIAAWTGAMLAMVLFTAVGILFLKRNNGARIALGIFYSISLVTGLMILVPSVVSASKLDASVAVFGIVTTLIPLGMIFLLVWFTLFDKSVKFYFKNK